MGEKMSLTQIQIKKEKSTSNGFLRVKVYPFNTIEDKEVPDDVKITVSEDILISDWMRAEIIRDNEKIEAYAIYVLDLENPAKTNLIVISKNGKITVLPDECRMFYGPYEDIIECEVSEQ